MNLFLLAVNAAACSRAHCDKHVIKMILEACQLLFGAHYANQPTESDWLQKVTEEVPESGDPMKWTHRHHRLSVWVRWCPANYSFTAALGVALCDEYRYRYGAEKRHLREGHLKWLQANLPPFPQTPDDDARLQKGFTSTKGLPPKCSPMPLSMPEEYQDDNAVTAYRAYYKGDKREFATWKKRRPPTWWTTSEVKRQKVEDEGAERGTGPSKRGRRRK